MCPREGRRAQRAFRCLTSAYYCIVATFFCGVSGDANPSEAVAVAVRTPTQFQVAVRQGVKHIVINEHLDMTDTPRFSETTIMDAGMIAIVSTNTGAYTRTIRGNCTGPPPIADLSPPRNSGAGQCVIIVREDFLEVPLENSQVWLSNLYITLPGVEKNHTTLIGIHGGDVYLTDMTFVADGDKARAIDVKENRRVYVGNSHFSMFSKDKDGVMRLEPGARATISDTEFLKNTVATGKPDAVASGPVMGLYAGLDGGGSQASAAWFQNCQFGDHTSSVSGEVSVENRNCRVYSNTKLPGVWDLELGREVSAWPLAQPGGDASEPLDNVFAEVESAGSDFLRPSDDFFQRIVGEESRDTRLESATIQNLPAGTEFITRDPYAGISGDDDFWTAKTIGLIAGLGGGAVLCALAALVAAWCICFRKNSDVDRHTDAKSMARTGTEAESAVPAMHHPNWSGNPGLGTPSHTGGNSSLESGLNPVLYGHAGAAPTPSSQSSAPHGPYHGAPYGVPAGGNYGGPNYIGSYAGSYGGAPTPQAGSHAGGSQLGGYGGPAAYGAKSYAGSDYRQEAATPPAGGGYGSGFDSGAAGSAMRDAPPMHGSIVNTSAMGSTQPGDGAGDGGYSGIPQPVAVGTGSAAQPLAPIGSADEETGSMLGPPPMLPSGASPAPSSAPAPPRLDADGRVVASPPTAAEAAAAPPAPEAPEPAPAPAGPKVGEPHTAHITRNLPSQPDRAADLLALGNTTDANQGPFSASAAGRGGGVYAPPAAAGVAATAATAAAAAAKEPSPKEPVRSARPAHDRLSTQVFDKTVAPDMDIADFTHEKVVDMLEDVHSDKALFRGKYELLGSVHQRLSGTGVVQFASTVDSNATGDRDVAVKFYIKRAAFDRVASMYANPQVKLSMSAIREVVANNAGEATGSAVLPPAIVMKRGEPLEEWAQRLRPNLPTALNALCGIAALLQELHERGYIYYAMKPSNVAWFGDEKKWRLVDFACAARKGMRTGLSFSLNYAAPEIIIAQESGQRTLDVSAAADVWALGVVAYELLSGTRTFTPGTPTTEIRNMISGRLPLPWEEQEPKQLRTLRHSVLSCLARNAADRPSAAEVHSAWKNLLDFAAVKHTEVAA